MVAPGTVEEPGRGRVLWRPPADVRDRSRIGRYLSWLAAERDLDFDGYADLWRWSVTDLDGFWRSIWDHFALDSTAPVTAALADAAMPGARWFPGVELNYAAHALRAEPDGPALVGLSAGRGRGSSCRWPSCASRSPGAGPGSSARGSGGETGSPRTCPTSPRPSSPCSPPPASAPSGRRAPPSSAPAAWSTAGSRSSRSCCWPSTATATAPRRSTGARRWRRSGRRCRRSAPP